MQDAGTILLILSGFAIALLLAFTLYKVLDLCAPHIVGGHDYVVGNMYTITPEEEEELSFSESELRKLDSDSEGDLNSGQEEVDLERDVV
jgi:hypothetical protein